MAAANEMVIAAAVVGVAIDAKLAAEALAFLIADGANRFSAGTGAGAAGAGAGAAAGAVAGGLVRGGWG